MSRAFVNEDAGSGGGSERKYRLPPRGHPSFDEEAAKALLVAAVAGDTGSAESATGYYWGERKLRPIVEGIRARARAEGDAELARAAERFLR
ncbi:MAG: hypothetical protein WKG32_07070 [Gemmatimonadaceae bacterium]